jgi:sialate O-acetylesterase
MKTDRRLLPFKSALSGLAALSLAGLLSAPAARAEVRLPAIFGHNMVLQQNLPILVWGTAEPGEKVRVTFAGETAAVEANPEGRWKATLPPMKAGAAPGALTVAGTNTVVFTNVVVGEVWLCSGQSNMAFTGANDSEAGTEMPAANWPSIRLFTVHLLDEASERPRDNVDGSWTPCTPPAMGSFSAVGYFFGRDLHRALNVPIGLINASRGGTPAEGWTRRARMESDPELRESIVLYEKRTNDVEGEKRKFDAVIAKWEREAKEAKTAGRPEPHRPRWVAPADAPGRPGNLWNGMVAPLIPFAIRGVTWYQGEANASRADRYARLFPALIQDWRAQWSQGDFPFLFVQLPRLYAREPLPNDHFWARLREAQLKTLQVTNTGMAVTIDLGPDDQVPVIHPPYKKEIGQRLALWALHDIYGKREIEPSGPLYDRMTVEGDKVRVSFRSLGGGLVSRAADGVKGFALAGEDRRFVWAEARIDGDTVVVSSPEVKRPVAVRYGWAGNPSVSLFNRAGLPASPFRSDDWPFDRYNPLTPRKRP